MSIPLLFAKRGFHPRQIFSALQGAWLEPTPGFIWQENTGVTPTTTGGQTIGLVLDQSQGAVLGPELVTNGDFSNGTTGWTAGNNSVITPQSGGLRVGYGGSPYAGVNSTQFDLTIGKTYRITYSVTEYSDGGDLYVFVSALSNGAGLRSLTLNIPNGTGSGEAFFIAGTSTARFNIGDGRAFMGVGGYFTIDNISVREILGNHASQSVSGNRPTYQLDSNSLPLARHDATDSLSVSLPNLGGGIFSASGSVYFATPQGMSALHGQSMGTTYTLPALSTDIYSWMVLPQRLNTALEGRLERYMERKAGIAGPDYLLDNSDNQLTADDGTEFLLRA